MSAPKQNPGAAKACLSRENIIGVVVFTLLAVVFFRDFLGETRYMLGGGDNLVSYDLMQWGKDTLLAGEMPFWNPYIFGGIPAYSGLSFTVFYPFMMWLLFPIYTAINVFFVFHAILAGVAMYCYLRHKQLSGLAAIGGGIIYMLSGYYISLAFIGHNTKLAVMALSPLLMLATEKSLARCEQQDHSYLQPSLLAGVLLGLMLLASHIQAIYYILMVVGSYTGWQIWGWIRAQEHQKTQRGLIFVALLFGVGLGIAAIQFLPLYEYSRLCNRHDGTSWAYATTWSLPPGELLSFVWPSLYNFGRYYWGENPFVQDTPYLGILPLVLTAFCLLHYRLNQQRAIRFWGIVILAALMLALGKFFIAYKALYHFLPGFDKFRVPRMFVVLVTYGVAVLAAYGLHLSTSTETEPQPKARISTFSWVLLGLALLGLLPWAIDAVAGTHLIRDLVLYIGNNGLELAANKLNAFRANLPLAVTNYGRQSALLLLCAALFIARDLLPTKQRQIWGLVVVMVIAGDLFLHQSRLITKIDVPQQIQSSPPLLEQLKKDQEPFRFLALSPRYGQNRGVTAGVASMRGSYPLLPRYLDQVVKQITSRQPGYSTLVDLFNVKYIIAAFKIDNPELYPVVEGPLDNVYQRFQTLPRFYLRQQHFFQPDDDKAFLALQDGSYKPLKSGLMINAPETEIDYPAGAPATESQDKIMVVSYEPNRIELKVASRGNKWIACSETWLPGWQATINGKPAKIFRANYFQRALPIGPGEHTVVLRFRPQSFDAGRIITLLTVLATGLALAFIYKKERQ